MSAVDKTNKSSPGHRERLRKSFIGGGHLSDTDILELLLFYSIPQKDVRPLASQLIAKYGSLRGVLAADFKSLSKSKGLKEYSATLLKIAYSLINKSTATSVADAPYKPAPQQPTLFEVSPDIKASAARKKQAAEKSVQSRKASVFSSALLKESIEILPRLPQTADINGIKEYLRNNLHFSALETRQHYAAYIALRIFPAGNVDNAILKFAQRYTGRQELRDAAYYRFCLAEPIMVEIVNDLLIPAVGAGTITRLQLRNFMGQRFPQSKNIEKGARAIVDALAAAGIARADSKAFYFAYREIALPSFAFILHSEFHDAGMYDIGLLEKNQHIGALLWDPSKLLAALYELRNKGIISKVSEIDNVRQFTVRWKLDEAVEKL